MPDDYPTIQQAVDNASDGDTIFVRSGTYHEIFHNNLMNNSPNAYDSNPASNDWHHPNVLDGNYWFDYTGVDDGSGTGKHAIAGDGIGDTNIPHHGANYDNYLFVNDSPAGHGQNCTSFKPIQTK